MSRLLLGSVIGAAVLLSVALLAGFGGGFAVSALDAQTGPVLRRYASADEFQRYLRTLATHRTAADSGSRPRDNSRRKRSL